MRDRPPRPPPPRAATARTTLRDTLIAAGHMGATTTARELSVAAGISEKDVAAHLEHLARSLPHEGLRLAVRPATCLACEYAFTDRAKHTAPSACPACRSERIAPPSFHVEAGPLTPPRARAHRPRGDEDDAADEG